MLTLGDGEAKVVLAARVTPGRL